jgi:hypothetical protein
MNEYFLINRNPIKIDIDKNKAYCFYEYEYVKDDECINWLKAKANYTLPKELDYFIYKDEFHGDLGNTCRITVGFKFKNKTDEILWLLKQD